MLSNWSRALIKASCPSPARSCNIRLNPDALPNSGIGGGAIRSEHWILTCHVEQLVTRVDQGFMSESGAILQHQAESRCIAQLRNRRRRNRNDHCIIEM